MRAVPQVAGGIVLDVQRAGRTAQSLAAPRGGTVSGTLLNHEIHRVLGLAFGRDVDAAAAKVVAATAVAGSANGTVPPAMAELLSAPTWQPALYAEVELPAGARQEGAVSTLFVLNALQSIALDLNEEPLSAAGDKELSGMRFALLRRMAVGAVEYAATCGNAVCEAGELAACARDCPRWVAPGDSMLEDGRPCSGAGRWLATGDGGCMCFKGYMGVACEQCWLGWDRHAGGPHPPPPPAPVPE